MATHFSGPVISTGGFQGNLTGNVTGNLTGNVTGNVTGAVIQTATDHGADGAIAPTEGIATVSKVAAIAATVAAPGAGNVGKRLTIIVLTTAAHVVVVAGLAGGTTLTFSDAGESVTLYAVSATVWALIANNGAVQTA